MKKYLLTAVLLCATIVSLAQNKRSSIEPISDCEGAVNIFKSGDYTLQFPGNGGIYNEFAAYPSLSELSSSNVIWLTFIADYNGVLFLNTEIDQNFIQMVIFEEGAGSMCEELASGTAEIKRLIIANSEKTIGLREQASEGYLYPLEVHAGTKISIALTTVEKVRAFVKMNFLFKPKGSHAYSNESKVVDLRDDEFSPSLTIRIRDKSTKETITSNFLIAGLKELKALYRGSDFLFTINRAGKIDIQCDAEGYFYLDTTFTLQVNINREIIIYLDPVAKGKSIQIEEIEFSQGTSEFLVGTETKLRRLKDFMALNAEVQIEIQGHVNASGEDNGFASQKLSESRAKKVMQYLIDNGIAKERMTAVGYGNTRPLFPQPKFAAEEQANRRVEILIR
jgi:outer membrane protein OmpA-like peptidoglycan-associated protein